MDVLLQLLVNGLMTGAVLALPAVAFNMIHAVVRISNFSLASHMTLGAFAGYLANTLLGWPLFAAAAAAFLVAGLVGVATDYFALRPLRGAGTFIVVIASLALNMVMENVLRFAFGNDPRGLNIPVMRDIRFGGARIDPQQLQNMAIAIVAVVLLYGLLDFTRLGRAMRAAADNPSLADIKGIDPEAMARLANFLAMGLGGIAGLLLANASAVDPLLGFRVMLPVFAAAVVGGLGRLWGGVAGGILIGVAQEVSLLVIPPSYRTAVGFVVILGVLALMPNGFFNQRN